MKKFIILTSGAEHLAKNLQKLSAKTDSEVITLAKNKDNSRIFPDGEIYARIPGINKLENKKVTVVHSGMPNPNDGLAELELAIQILKNTKAKIEVFFAYFPYGMQDAAFEAGEANAAEELIKKFTDYYGIKKIYVLDPHFGKRSWQNKYPIINISAVPLLVKKAKKDFGSDILFLSCDKGGKRRTGISGTEKKRLDSFKVEFLSHNIDFKGKNIAVVDDIIETGGTLLKFYKLAKDSGAKNVIALITHGVLPEGIKKIKKEF